MVQMFVNGDYMVHNMLFVLQMSGMRSYVEEQKLEMEKSHAAEVEDVLEKVCTSSGHSEHCLHWHRCQHYRFRAGNLAFRVPSRFLVKTSRFFAYFALIEPCIYFYYFVCACLVFKAASIRAPT